MATNPTLLTQPIAENGAKNVIPNTTATPGAMSQDQGFPAETSLPLGAGGVAPSREDFNGAFNLLSGVAYYAQKGWQFQFDAGQDYYAGCIVRDTTDGKLYECINDVAAGGSAPSADSVNWKEYGVDPSMFANPDLSNLTATGEARFDHVVVDSYYDSTTGDWWRKYADGWLEQGGQYVSTTASYAFDTTVTFLTPFADTAYSIQVTGIGSESGNVPTGAGISGYAAKTTTTVRIGINAISSSYSWNLGMAWVAFGMGASA